MVFALGMTVMPLHSGYSQTEPWVITAFHSDITVENTGSVTIQETIAVDFGSEEKHGIFRTIPYIYTDTDHPISTPLTVTDVTMDNATIPYTITKESGYVEIKIGDPDITISGNHRYVVSYTITGILRNTGSVDELYWNVTGNNWPVPITYVSAKVTLPRDDRISLLQSSCYVGVVGASTTCLQEKSDHSIAFSHKDLLSGEGMTVAVGYTPGIIPAPTPLAPPTIEDALKNPFTIIVGGFVALLGCFLCLRVWWALGRDHVWKRKHLHDTTAPETTMPLFHRDVVSVEYESPDGLKPAELGTIIDEKVDTLDVTATIVDLAVHGYLTITEQAKTWLLGKSDYVLTRTEKTTESLNPYESLLLHKLFAGGNTVALSSLKNSFYKDLESIKESIYTTVQKKDVFFHHPQKARTYAFLGAIGIGAVGIGGVIFAINRITNSFTLSSFDCTILGGSSGLVVTGMLALVLAPFMSSRTAKGREIYRRILGYKLFVSGTEKYRQPFFEKENIFMDVLPYAIVFGVTEKLAHAMDQMGVKPPTPSWYIGTTPFHLHSFATSMNTFSSTITSTMASKPHSSGSGGGGFSGGGFGGGGGGSW